MHLIAGAQSANGMLDGSFICPLHLIDLFSVMQELKRWNSLQKHDAVMLLRPQRKGRSRDTYSNPCLAGK